MKKHTIGLLVIVMLMAFIGLLYMQVSYISEVYRSRNEQFNEAVRKALSQVNHEIEKDEIHRLIEQNQQLSQLPTPNSLQRSTPNISIDPQGFKLDQLPIDPLVKPRPPREGDRFVDTSRMLQSQLIDKMASLRDIMMEYAIDKLIRGHKTPFYDRVSQHQLEVYLDSYLSEAGISLRYIYEVTDRNGHIYFTNGRISKEKSAGLYTQAIFPNDPPSDLHFLRVLFPEKRQYISGTIDFLVPSIIFTTLLFFTAIITIIMLYRQKKLAELKNDFINNMTHELKTPVSTIILGSQMLSDSDVEKTPEVSRQILNSITQEGTRLNFLIEKVLQISLFEREKVAFKFKEIDVQELLISIANTFSIKTESYNGEIDIELDAENTDVYADEMHLTNVLFNLLDNAIKYRRPDVPPHLVVGTYNEANDLCIYVKDNGIGIKKEYLKKVFDRFFRVPTGNVHDVKGFGLGLAYVYKIISEHGGSIRAESEVGRGTTFIITLPLINSPKQ